jgi:hypothetical protein
MRSFEILPELEWQFLTDVSEHSIGSIFKYQIAHGEFLDHLIHS